MSEQAPVRGLGTRSTGSFATPDEVQGRRPEELRAAESRPDELGPGELRPGELRAEELRAEVQRLQQELVRAERKAVAAEERLTWLQDIGDAMSRRVRPEDAMQRILERVLRMVGAQHGTLYLAEDDGQVLVSRVMQGGALREIRLALGEGLAGHCARTQRAVNVKDAHRDPRFNDAIDRVTGVRTRAVLCVPMRDRRGRLLGVVQVLNKRDGTYFTLDDELMLGSVAISIGILVENFRFYLEEIVRNIELNEIREKLEERVRDLDALFELQRALSVADDQDDELESALVDVGKGEDQV